jgi:DNA polymerase I-like protein with 3'-5' exonuclease and polymerase domains
MSYAILKPVSVPKLPASDIYILSSNTLSTLRKFIDRIPHESIVAIDFETNGTQAADPAVFPVGLGVSYKQETFYIDLQTQSDESIEYIRQFLLSPDYQFIGHNVFFDGAIAQAQLGRWSNWIACTYGMTRQLASEGWFGQKYGLKHLQVELLEWDSKGDIELDRWLVASGNVKNFDLYNKWTEEERLANWDEKGGREGGVKPDKALMYRAPAAILGYYCGLDAYSTYKLYTSVLLPAIESLPVNAREVFLHYHSVFMKNVELLVDQQLRGIHIDLEQLDKFEERTRKRIIEEEARFRVHPDVASYLREWYLDKAEEIREPEKYKKLPVLGAEPEKLNKKGEVSKSWLKWDEKRQKIADLGPGEVSKNWLNWKEGLNEKLELCNFNVHSGPQRAWLFYTKLNMPVKVETKSGKPATDKKALPGFGPAGHQLAKLDKQVKLLSFVGGLRKQLYGNLAHQQFRTPGTFTGRLAGSGGFNWQNPPKSGGFMAALSARPGNIWCSLDFASLENYVLAELSQDSSLLKLYGPGASPFQDAYLFNASQLPVIGPKILSSGYDPHNPTEESVARAKKECKRERSIGKTLTLASNYGAGAAKIQQNLNLDGIPITFTEAKAMQSAFWKIYSGIKEYEAYLLDELERHGGWVYNGIGRPICVYVDKKKDIINRVVQSTGHDILMYYIDIIDRLVIERDLIAYPAMLNTHDCTIWECAEEDGPELKQVFEDALHELNEWLQNGQDRKIIKLRGEAALIYNLAADKGLSPDD